jgi:photosystem II stability/assembly factor-like uncharacterized protein
LALAAGLPALAAVVVAPAPAAANGRFPATISVHFEPDNDQRILVGTTFGVLLSEDDGATWRWTCEANVQYSGTWDPVYAISPAGTIFASTPAGLSITRDNGCNWSFAPPPMQDQWISDVQVGSDGAIWVSTASSGFANDVYVSHDDGMSFTSTGLLVTLAWWKSLRVAPSDPNRVYVSGYQLDGPADGGDGLPAPLLYRSDDGGAGWIEIPFSMMGQSQLFIVGVSPSDPDVVFAKLDGTPNDDLLRSDDGGVAWTPVASFGDDVLGFAPRAGSAQVVAGSPVNLVDPAHGDVRISNDDGVSFTQQTWTEATNVPRMACLGERRDMELFACGANWTPDRMAIGRSSDSLSWSKVMRFCEIDGPLECPAGSQHETLCAPLWPAMADQFGIPCAIDAGPMVDAGPRPDAGHHDESPSCGCRLGRGGSVGGAVTLGLAAAAWLLIRRRRRRR